MGYLYIVLRLEVYKLNSFWRCFDLKKIGRVVSVSDGKLVVKAEGTIKIGAEVYDSGERHIGTVSDYFGPTAGPYLLISTKKEPGQLVGEELYA